MKNGSNSLGGRLPAQFAIKSRIWSVLLAQLLVPKAAPASESLLHQGGVGMEREEGAGGGTDPGGCREAEKEKGKGKKGKGKAVKG